MRRAGATIAMAALVLSGCAATPKPTCPVGQAPMRTAQLFLGGKAPARPTEADLRRFVDKEVTPRFPDGVTVVAGGGRWKGVENRMIRDAAKVVLIVLPTSGDSRASVEAVRAAYRLRFNQDSVVVMPPPACTKL